MAKSKVAQWCFLAVLLALTHVLAATDTTTTDDTGDPTTDDTSNTTTQTSTVGDPTTDDTSNTATQTSTVGDPTTDDTSNTATQTSTVGDPTTDDNSNTATQTSTAGDPTTDDTSNTATQTSTAGDPTTDHTSSTATQISDIDDPTTEENEASVSSTTTKQPSMDESTTTKEAQHDESTTTRPELNTTRYYGQFRVPAMMFTDSLQDKTTDEYAKRAAEVKTELTRIYKKSENIGSKLVDVTDIAFTKGSVIVDFSLWVDASIEDKDLLREILVNEKKFKIGGFDVDPKSIRVSGKKLGGKGPAFPWLPVVLGTILSVVLLVLVVILVIFTVRKFREAKLRRWESSDDEEDVNKHYKHYSPTATKEQRMWKERTPTMPPLDPAALQRERYDRQRLDVISRAMSKVANINWSVIRNFSQRNPGQQGDVLQRSAPAQRGNDVWSWDQAK